MKTERESENERDLIGKKDRERGERQRKIVKERDRER